MKYKFTYKEVNRFMDSLDIEYRGSRCRTYESLARTLTDNTVSQMNITTIARRIKSNLTSGKNWYHKLEEYDPNLEINLQDLDAPVEIEKGVIVNSRSEFESYLEKHYKRSKRFINKIIENAMVKEGKTLLNAMEDAMLGVLKSVVNQQEYDSIDRGNKVPERSRIKFSLY